MTQDRPTGQEIDELIVQLRHDRPPAIFMAANRAADLLALVTPELTPPVPLPEGMETTAEEREQLMFQLSHRKFDGLAPTSMALLRDIDRALAEIARLTAELASMTARSDEAHAALRSEVALVTARVQLAREEERDIDGNARVAAYATAREQRAREEEREACAAICDARVATEQAYAIATPGDIELHTLRVAVVGTAQGIAAAIRARSTP